MVSFSFFIVEFLILSVIQSCSNFLATCFIIIFSVAFFVDISISKELKPYETPLVIGYTFRVFLLYFDIFGRNIYSLPGSGGDSEGFYETTIKFASGSKITYGAPFTKIMGVISKFIGTNRLYLQFIIVLFSIIALVFAAKALSIIYEDIKIKQQAMMLLALLPNYAILSSIYLRESMIVMLLSISLYCFIYWMKYSSYWKLFIAFAFVFGAASLHSGVIGIAIGYIIVILLYNNKQERFNITEKGIVLAVLLLFLVSFLYLNYGDVLFGKMNGIESISDIADGSSRGNSSYAKYVGDSSTPLNMIIYTLPRIFFFIFTPLPWQWRGLSDIIAFCFSSMFYFWAIVSVIKYYRDDNVHKKNYNLVISLTIIIICTIFIFAWGVSNSGTALRHRDKLIVHFVILWCCTVKECKLSKRTNYAMSINS